MKKLLPLLFCFCPLWLQADLLTDIVTGKYRPESLPAMELLPDGERYAVLRDNAVLACSLKTGQTVDTLFSAASAKGVKLEYVEGWMPGPDERWLLVYTNAKKVYRRSFTADWYIYDRRRRELKPLSQTPVQEPCFSPDGNYIAFSRSNNLYIHKLLFGTEVAVTTDGAQGRIINGTPDWLYEEEFSTTCLFCFSPDSKQLAFVRLDETEVPAFHWEEMLGGGYPADFSLKYPRAGEKNAVPRVVVYDTYYKSLKTMDIGQETDIYIPRIRWTNSSESLAVFRLNRNQNKLDMLLCNPKSTVSQLCCSEENKRGYVDYEQADELQFLADNSFIAVSEQDGWRHVYLYSANGQRLRQLTRGCFDVTAVYGLDEATQTLYYQAAPTPLTRKVYALNLKKNRLSELTPEEGTHSARFAPGYGCYVESFSSLTMPPRYSVCTSQGRVIRTMLDNNALQKRWEALGLPQKEFFRMVTERGDTLNGWMLRPTAEPMGAHELAGRRNTARYPVLMVQYSGPASQQVLNHWRTDWEYALAQEGIMTVCVDGRGTGARGRDFRQQTYMNLGQMEAQDQVAAARWLQSREDVDPARIGIWGWSYGGFMTLMAMSQTDAPFRCGIAVAPVTDFRLYDSAYTERFMRRPQANEGGYKACALPQKADRLQGRLLICHGLADDNVHCQQTWLYVDALVEAGKQFEMQIYPDDNHFLRKRRNQEHVYQRKLKFLRENL